MFHKCQLCRWETGFLLRGRLHWKVPGQSSVAATRGSSPWRWRRDALSTRHMQVCHKQWNQLAATHADAFRRVSCLCKTAHRENLSRVMCDYCRFRSEKSPVKCEVCGKMLSGVREVQAHAMAHEGKVQKCTHCDYVTVFKSVSCLRHANNLIFSSMKLENLI